MSKRSKVLLGVAGLVVLLTAMAVVAEGVEVRFSPSKPLIGQRIVFNAWLSASQGLPKGAEWRWYVDGKLCDGKGNKLEFAFADSSYHLVKVEADIGGLTKSACKLVRAFPNQASIADSGYAEEITDEEYQEWLRWHRIEFYVLIAIGYFIMLAGQK